MILLDTCALIWNVNEDPVARKARSAIARAAKAGELFLSPISAWEIGVLVRRGRLRVRLPVETYVSRAFTQPGVRTAAFTPEIAVQSSSLPGDFHDDPADRILVATAVLMELTLVTRDRRILDYGRQGHVSVLAC